jgi:anti-anti-sigma regulatory factor
MFLRIERLVGEKDITILRLSGRIEAEHMDTLRELLKQEKGRLAIDLREVTLINREAITFLALTEADGVELRNCADYIREWITKERDRQ